MSLRLKLLLLSLLTLTLPWAGCQYAREMESVLREGEKQALVAVAQTIAASLQGRTDLLYRGDAAGFAERTTFDLLPIPLPSEPFIDGNADEWPDNANAWRYFSRGADRCGILTGVHERMLYALVDVRDNRPVFGAPAAGALDAPTFGDRIWIGFEDADGAERQVFLAPTSAGPVRAQRIETRELGRQVAVEEPRIEAAWRLIAGGYRVELQLPLSMIGTRFGVLVDDRDERGAVPASFGTLRGDDLTTRGRLVAASPELPAYLSQFMQPGLALTVTTPLGGVLSEANALGTPAAEQGQNRGILARFYRRVLDEPGQPGITQASAPIFDQDHARTIGVLGVAQTADRWLALRDRALTTLLNVTLITSALAVLAMFGFAVYLAVRLARLRKASESALTREGLVTTFPETGAADELGDVARSFSTLLGRLGDYTGYLRTLAGKLAHEIRTPLTIVRSSLENLESEGITPAAKVYLDRALQGSDRLNAIVVAMGAATRVEEAIQSSERTRFDVAAVIGSSVESYRIAFPQRLFACELPSEGSVMLDGAPDLVVQMLDKLIENAVDFSPEGATITVRVTLEPDAVRLDVDNPGPTIPPEARSRLFESLWQSRPGKDSRPHFGLGLYIVKLIADFHGGSAVADALPTDSGARLSVRFPRLS